MSRFGYVAHKRLALGDNELNRDNATRASLVKTHKADIRTGYEATIEKGVNDGVVFVMDLSDPPAKDFAEQLDGGPSEIGVQMTAIEGGSKPGSTLIRIEVFPFDVAREIAKLTIAPTDSLVRRPPAGSILVVVLAAGGAGTFHLSVQ